MESYENLQVSDLYVGKQISYPIGWNYKHMKMRTIRTSAWVYYTLSKIAVAVQYTNKVAVVIDVDTDSEIATAIYQHDDLYYILTFR